MSNIFGLINSDSKICIRSKANKINLTVCNNNKYSADDLIKDVENMASKIPQCKSIYLGNNIPNYHLLVDKCKKFIITNSVDASFVKQMIEKDKIYCLLIRDEFINSHDEQYLDFDFRDTKLNIGSECLKYVVSNNFKIKKLALNMTHQEYMTSIQDDELFDDFISSLKYLFDNNDIQYFKMFIDTPIIEHKNQTKLLNFCKTLDVKDMILDCHQSDDDENPSPMGNARSLINMGVFSKIMLSLENFVHEDIELNKENYKLIHFSLWGHFSESFIPDDINELVENNNKYIADKRFKHVKPINN